MKLRRRLLLKGLGGVVLGLPLLESLGPRLAHAQAAARPRFAVFMRQANGVAQAGNGEPERFWPRALGALSTASLSAADADRAVSELKDHASKLLIVRGLKFQFSGNGCGHSGGGNQCLTAARVSSTPSANRSLSMGESVDNRIARELNPAGREPLTLYAGRKDGYLDEVLSYRGPQQLRPAEGNPFNAYTRMVGLGGADTSVQQRLASAQKSVNDLVRLEMKALQARPELSKSDRDRLDLHFSSIRDLEVQMAQTCNLPAAQVTALQGMGQNQAFLQNDKLEEVARLQLDLIALGLACGYTRTATLQVGDGNDSTGHLINGVRQPSFHFISHRVQSDGESGAAISGAQEKHHQVDRIHGRLFKHLLDKLAAAGILDDGVAVWTNDIAHGVSHAYTNMPYVLAGSCGGYLKTGAYVDAGGGAMVAHNKLLNTILNAVGCKKTDGSPVDDFGDASLPKGELAAIKA